MRLYAHAESRSPLQTKHKYTHASARLYSPTLPATTHTVLQPDRYQQRWALRCRPARTVRLRPIRSGATETPGSLIGTNSNDSKRISLFEQGSTTYAYKVLKQSSMHNHGQIFEDRAQYVACACESRCRSQDKLLG